MQPAARLIAFYLPQFFPIPENDKWWGAGFTEWTNVAKAKPLFPGHWQPHLPADLGFYDLRVPETRVAQAKLAREAGVEGFCYWHYWFGGGRRILERPFNEVLSSGEPNFPFCLAWANQSWTGVWHGSPGTTLIEQNYPGKEDEEAHFKWCCTAFRDSRYMCVDGKPIFVVYAPHDMPCTASFIEHWRTLAERAGLPGLFFVAIGYRFDREVDPYRDPIYESFDAVTALEPQDYLDGPGRAASKRIQSRLRELNAGRILNRLKWGRFLRPKRIDYADVAAHAFESMPEGTRFLPCVMPNWDNTPRSGYKGVVYENSTPKLFRQVLEKAVSKVSEQPPSTALVFLKAWNEWAEGNYVEPDVRFGHQYLEVIRQVMQLPKTSVVEV
jgi:hypothetical protein